MGDRSVFVVIHYSFVSLSL